LTTKIKSETITFEESLENLNIVDVPSSCIKGVDDLLMLGDLNEQSLLHITRERFYEDKVYSSIGSPILISVNPYKKLHDDDMFIKDYKEKISQQNIMVSLAIKLEYE